ncbi:Aldo/keto reductase, partial [Russula aff. rugulosa BPL654]
GTSNIGLAGRTGVSVSSVDTAQDLIDVFSERYRELDSARIYGDGTTEELLSKLDLRGGSIDTKFHPRNHPGGHQPEAIRFVVETCLKALHPHKIRVLYLHRPDRSVPFENTLREINKLHQEGKFELFGLSNYPAWEVVEIIHICKVNNWIEPTYCQVLYNAISRTIESELIPAARKYGIRMITYNSLAAGFLTGRISSREDVSRMDNISNSANSWLSPVLQERYLNDSQFEAMRVVTAAAEKADTTLAEIGYRWLQHHSALSPTDGIIFGSSTPAHLKSNMESVMKGPLPEEVVSALDTAYKIVGHDAPQYWR